MNRRAFSFSLLFLLLFSLLPTLPAQAATTFNDSAFATTWNRVDKPVQEIPGLGRGYTWGPPVQGSETITSEPYETGTRKVQYFDKARMEINYPNGNTADLFYVTTGLLVKELVTGYRQDGDNTYHIFAPSQVQVAGDPNTGNANAIAPTYASFGSVITTGGTDKAKPNLVGSQVTSRINRAGQVSDFTPPVPVVLTAYDELTYHNIADVFVNYGNQTGTIWNGNSYGQDSLFFGNAVYVLGRPVTEPLWTRAVVAGVEKDVLVQLFERRVLTYTPDNPAGFKVEMGNVGQHYYRWRYMLNQQYPDTSSSFTRLGEFGRDTGGMREPKMIAVDSRENVYLGDTDNRLIRFGIDGQIKGQFGGSGSGDGQFTSLVDIAIDGQDNLYTLDSTGNRVQKFDSNGNFLLKWGNTGQLNNPRSLAVDAQNNVYVQDQNGVQKFDSSGHLLSGWASPTGGNGRWNFPVGLALDNAGNVFVLDVGVTGRMPLGIVKKYDPTGHFLLSWDAGIVSFAGSFSGDGQGNLLMQTNRYDSNGNLLGKVAGDVVSPVDGQTPFPYALTANSQGQVYFTAGPSIYKVDRTGKLLAFFSAFGRKDGLVLMPGGVAVDGANNIYVYDTLNYRVQKFDSDGNFLLKWGSMGTGNGQFGGQGTVAVDSTGNVYVADARNQRVQKFDPQGHFLLKWGSAPVTNADCQGTFANPNGIAVAPDGAVFVIDGNVKCIQKFDPQGKFLQLWSGPGATDLSEISANTIAADRQGNLYFASEQNSCIYKLDSYFKNLQAWGEFGDTPGQLNRPSAITVDSHNNLYIIDQSKNRLQKFDPTGKLLAFTTLTNDQSSIISGIAVDSRGIVYLSDSRANRILKYSQS